MFERNRVDQRSQFNTVNRPVQITLNDGREIRARMVMRETRRVADEINEGGGFIELYPYGGDPIMLSKSAVQSICETNVPAADQLSNQDVMQGTFDPYELLGLPRGADYQTVRAAYHAKAKAYHPDRFSAMDVPDEILEYVCAVSRRLNVAYAELSPRGTNDGATRPDEKPEPSSFETMPQEAPEAERPPVFPQQPLDKAQQTASFRPKGPMTPHPQA